MNANVNRRGFMGIIGGAFSSLIPSMFRKSPRVETSIPEPARLSQDWMELDGSLDQRIRTYFDDHSEAAEAFGLVPKPVESINRFSEESELKPITEPVLARTIPTRESDQGLIFEPEGWFKDEFLERMGDPTFDEDDCFVKYEKGELTDEEYGAYQRFISNDYPVTQTEPVGNTSNRSEAEAPSDSESRRDSERLIISRDSVPVIWPDSKVLAA